MSSMYTHSAFDVSDGVLSDRVYACGRKTGLLCRNIGIQLNCQENAQKAHL